MSGTLPTLARRLQVVVLVVVLLSLLTFGIAEYDALVAGGLMVGALAGWCVTELGQRGIPRWAAGIILLGVLVGAVVRSLEGTPVVSAFSTFLGAIIVLKLWERREVQDYGQLLTLCVFLLIGAALTATTLWVGIMLLLLTPVLGAAVMMYQVHAAAARAARWSHAGAALRVPWRPLRAGLLALVCVLVFAGYVVASGLFVVVPRGVGFQQFAQFTPVAAGRQTGFTDRVDLGRGGLISESQATVMEVRIRRESTRTEPFTPTNPLYFRGLVLDTYTRGVWAASPPGEHGRREVRDPGQRLRLRSDRGVTGVLLQEFRPRGGVSRLPVFALNRPISVQIASREQGPVEFDVDDRWRIVSMRTSPTTGLRYHVRSVPETADPAASWTRQPVEPPPDRIAALAREILRAAGIDPDPRSRPVGDDAQAVRIFEQYFLGEGFEYTLDSPTPPLRAEPTEHFLFSQRRGHCEHFASALALLCRGVGIEANVVAGYLSDELDPETGATIVRQAHAHAWVEARVGADIWRTFDATPQGEVRRLTTEARGFTARMSRWLDSIENAWNTRIATFDNAAQNRLFGRRSRQGDPWTSAWLDDLRRRMQPAEPETGASSSRPRRWAIFAILSLVPAIAWAAWVIVRRARSRQRSTYAAMDEHAARLARRIERSLARRAPRPPGATLQRWATVTSAGPQAQNAIRVLYDWVFAGRPPTREALRQVLVDLRAGSRA